MITPNFTPNSDNTKFASPANHSSSLNPCPTKQKTQPCSIQLVPTWLKLKYPLTEYVRDANAAYWWNITQSGLTTQGRVLAVSWRWHALAQQNKNFAELIPNPTIRFYTLKQIKDTKKR